MATYEAKRYDFSGANITALNGSNVASGTVAAARIADLATSKITSGTFADARISSDSVTQHVTAVTQATGTWTPTAVIGGFSTIYATYSRTGNIVTCVANFKYNGNDRTNTDNNSYTMGGLPITPRSASGQQHVGGGVYSFYKGAGSSGIVKINEGSTTINFYGHGADIATSTTYSGGGSDTLSYILQSQGDNGYIVTRKNMYQTMDTNRWGYLFLVYQV